MIELKNVVSLFDGMSGGQIALNRAEIKYENYYASELDKYAIQVTQSNYSNTIQLGNIIKLRRYLEKPELYERMLETSFVKQENKELIYHCIDLLLDGVDLLMGGSPCQGFSFAGKQLNFSDPRSKLFFEFVKIRDILKPKYFLLENVKMKKEYQDIISEFMRTGPIEINSALVSAQNRKRLYWANIEEIEQPEDRGILLKDIIEENVDDKYLLSNKANNRAINNPRNRSFKIEDNKCGALLSNQYKQSTDSLYVLDRPASMVGRRINERGVRDDYNKDVKLTQCLQVKKDNDKINCLTTVQKDTLLSSLPHGRYVDAYNNLDEGVHYRKLTPVECERLQTVPENYTNLVSNSQRYKMLGNGWIISVISHIFSYLK